MGHQKKILKITNVFPALILAKEMACSGWAFGTVQMYLFCTGDMYIDMITRAMQYNRLYFTLLTSPSHLDPKAKLAPFRPRKGEDYGVSPRTLLLPP
jgi:hypothetical protein